MQPNLTHYPKEDNRSRGSSATYESNKIFVGGLDVNASESDLKDYFGQFGDIANCIIKYKSDTKISRSFGFVTFKSQIARDNVLEIDDHIILGKKIDCKQAMTKEEAFQKHKIQISERRKLFVNNIPKGLKKRDIKSYFQNFGRVVDVNLIYKKKDKGFAFVVFESENQARSVLAQDRLDIRNHVLEIKLAIPKKELEKEQTEKIKYKTEPQIPTGIYDDNSDYNNYPVYRNEYEDQRMGYNSQPNIGKKPKMYYQQREPEPPSYLEEEYIPESPMGIHQHHQDYSRPHQHEHGGSRRPKMVYGHPPSKGIEGYIECPTCGAQVPVPSDLYILRSKLGPNQRPQPQPQPQRQRSPIRHINQYEEPQMSYMGTPQGFGMRRNPRPPEFSKYSYSPYYAPQQFRPLQRMDSPGQSQYSLREKRQNRKLKKQKPEKRKFLTKTRTIDEIDASFATKIGQRKK